MLRVMDLSLYNNSGGIYSIRIVSKYTTAFLSINGETQCVTLLCLSSKFMTYASFFYSKWIISQRNAIKPRFVIEILKRWSRIQKNYPYHYIHFLFLQLLFPELSSLKAMLIIVNVSYQWRSHRLYQWRSQSCYQWSIHRCYGSPKKSIFLFFLFHVFLFQSHHQLIDLISLVTLRLRF